MKNVQKMSLLLAGAMLALSAAAAPLFAAEPTKDIRVEQKTDKIAIDVKPGKKSFAVDESISLKVKVNKPAYLYIFNIGADNEKVTMLFPNQFDKNNKVLPSKKGITIPGKKTEFKSDREGMENVVVLASAKELNLDAAPQGNSKFFSVGKGMLDKSMKDIRVESRSAGAPEGDVKELKITIKNKK